MNEEILKKSHFFGLYNSVQSRIYAYLLTIVHSRDDAEEVLQETAIILWEKFDTYQLGTNFGVWAVQIARFKALEYLRKHKSRMFFDEAFYNAISDQAEESSSDVDGRSEALRFCIKKIPENNLKLLAMRYKKDISIKRISQLTGRSANGLYQSFSKILSALRNCMDKYIAQQNL
jgi:RNA polymerase sigma-70 factor (ECF subfamily)